MITKSLCTVQIVQNGKKYKVRIGESLSENSSKEEVSQKLLELNNFLFIGNGGIEDILQEDLPRFEKYENEILASKNPIVAFLYANFFIRDRWEQAEELIINNLDVFSFYVLMTIKTRTPDLEKYILTNPILIYNYCKNVFKYKKIPSEFHNAMIAHHLVDQNNVFVKKYFKIKKNRVK